MKRIIVFITLCATLGYAKAQVCGCTDPRANNYNPQATVNDGSCTYASTTVSPYYSNNLPTSLNGTSGLIYFDGKLYMARSKRSYNDFHVYLLSSLFAGSFSAGSYLIVANWLPATLGLYPIFLETSMLRECLFPDCCSKSLET